MRSQEETGEPGGARGSQEDPGGAKGRQRGPVQREPGDARGGERGIVSAATEACSFFSSMN